MTVSSPVAAASEKGFESQMTEPDMAELEARVSRTPVDDGKHDDRQLGVPPGTKRLPERLRVAGLPPGSEPRAAWLQLREVEGPRATMVDLYASSPVLAILSRTSSASKRGWSCGDGLRR